MRKIIILIISASKLIVAFVKDDGIVKFFNPISKTLIISCLIFLKEDKEKFETTVKLKFKKTWFWLN